MSGAQQVVEYQNQWALYRLPAELLLNILDRLDILEFPSVISAMFPLLRHHGIAPPILVGELSAMRSAAARGRVCQHAIPCHIGHRSGLATLPIELLLQTTGYLSTGDKVNFTIATWREFTVVVSSICAVVTAVND